MEGISENVRKQFLVNEPGKKQREAFKQMESSSNLLLSRLSSFLPQLAKENDSLFDDLQTGKKTAADVDIEVLGEKEDDDAEEEPQHIEMNLGMIMGEGESDQEELDLVVNKEPKDEHTPEKKLVQEL